jgi:hypothetical protein
VEKIVEHIKTTMPNQKLAITTMDGRTAIISCSPSVVAAFAGNSVGPRIPLKDDSVASPQMSQDHLSSFPRTRQEDPHRLMNPRHFCSTRA